MRRLSALALLAVALFANPARPVKRLVLLKVDGLNADLLYRTMSQIDPATGKSRLPWFTHIFAEQGLVLDNFYTRGISLSAPSWSMLDTGRHTVIRGNVEYDRYTGRVYDYLNFFPFYLNYARKTEVDMPGVQVLNRAGIPLLIDAWPYPRQFQSFQLFQRGVRFSTLNAVLGRRLKSELLAPVESGSPEPLSELLNRQPESELKSAAANPEVFYLDFYSGDIDHAGHATNNTANLAADLYRIDELAGRLWTAIQASPLAGQTLFVAVSDHGMNNRPEVLSQAFNLPDFFNSPAGGAHHVITNRHQLSDYKILGLDPMVQRVVNPSTASFYLAGQSSHYPTAWLDLDGNERAAIQLRNNDLNRIQILLQQAARPDLPAPIRQAAAQYLRDLLDRHRAGWTRTANELDAEISALSRVVESARAESAGRRHRWTAEQKRLGLDKEDRRDIRDLSWWQREITDYREYLTHLRALLNLQVDGARPFGRKIEACVPYLVLGDNNTESDLRHYVAGPGIQGLVLNGSGKLDEERSFRYVDYLPLLVSQRVRNNPQPALSNQPIDFLALRTRGGYLLYGSEDAQMFIQTDAQGRISARPVAGPWRAGLPLHLFEDPALAIPAGALKANWLAAFHTDTEWLQTTHRCRYSNGVVGITEELSPVENNVSGAPGMDPLILRYERRRRALVQADFHIFASDGWNFNARDFNPGGNHGGFFRISTHSVWMMNGPGLPVARIQEPYDSLSFASTLLSLLGKPVPMPDRVVRLYNETTGSSQ